MWNVKVLSVVVHKLWPRLKFLSTDDDNDNNNNNDDDAGVRRTKNSGRQTRSCTNLDFLILRVKTCESTTIYYNSLKDGNELPLSAKESKSKDLFQVIFTSERAV